MQREEVSSALSDLRIAVIGDVMLDLYQYGEVNRISPEAPVPVFEERGCETKAGGAANVALNLASLGCKVSLYAVVGVDNAGVLLREAVASAGIIDKTLNVDGFPTTQKTRVVSGSAHILRIDREEVVAPDRSIEIFERLLADAAEYDAVVVSDYAKGAVDQCSHYIGRLRQRGPLVTVDPKGRDFYRYRGADLITPNQKEFETIVGKCLDDEILIARAQVLRAELDLSKLMVTRSEKGATLISRNGKAVSRPSYAVEVNDVTGAGDTMISAATAALCLGFDDTRLLAFSNFCAGHVCAKFGTAVISAEDICDFFEK